MRITTQMSQNSSIHYLNKNYGNWAKLTEHISAERQVLELKDNPTAAVSGISILSSISRLEQYSSNIKAGISSLDMADVQLGSMKSTVEEIKSLVIGAADDSTTAAERQAMAIELADMLNYLLLTANGTDGERYLFGGTAGGSEPYSSIGTYVLYSGNDQSISIQTGTNSTTAVNVTGSDIFGSMTTTVDTGDLSPSVSLATDVSTPLDSLNGGNGVPAGKIVVSYSAYPDGLEVDLSGCDTLEDVKDRIEQATLEASGNLDPDNCSWLDGSNLDWKDLTDRYVKVTVNPDGTGLSLQEYDLGEALPEPTKAEARRGLDYSNQNGYSAGDVGTGGGAVYGKANHIYGNGGLYAPLSVDNSAGNTVASSLGIKGTANAYDAANPDARADGFIHGTDLNPAITAQTLLADLAGYNDAVYTITNGSIPGVTTIQEIGTDTDNVFGNWSLANLSAGYNCGSDGELYARVTRRSPPEDDLYVEVYAVPLDRAKATDLVAAGSCSSDGGTVELNEANGSGVSGSVGIVLGANVDEATIRLQADFGSGFQATVNVPAFVEETDASGISVDYQNILSGWNITGLDRPPADDYDLNHPASTDPDGNIQVRLFETEDADGNPCLRLELYRPAYGDQEETLVATGELALSGGTPSATAESGRIAIVGEPGFEGVGGSVYVEVPADGEFAGLDYTLTATFATVEDLMRAVNEAGVYTTLGINDSGTGLQFKSQLAGAYLTVSEDCDCYEQMGDTYQQLSGLDLNGLVQGVNSDANGNVHIEVAYYPEDPSRSDGKVLLVGEDGSQSLIDAGYYVRVYSDKDALSEAYEDRDNSSLVAVGYVAPDSLGTASPLVLSEKNDSGLSGTVDLNYFGGRDVDGDYDNPGITVTPGGLRSEGTLHAVFQEIDISGFTPGVHCDYSGTSHGEISVQGGVTTVAIYRDASRTHMAAKGELDAATGLVTLYETDKNGNYTLDANGERIAVGSMRIAENTLNDGQKETFTVEAGAVGASGQERESNLFSTIADTLAALNANDVEALHNLIDVLAADLDRLVAARADAGSRSSRLDLLNERYQDDILTYTSRYTSQVGMDSDALAKAIIEYSAAENAYTASLQVSSRYLQMSLLDYL